MRSWSAAEQINFLKVFGPIGLVFCLLCWGFVAWLVRQNGANDSLAVAEQEVEESAPHELPEDADARIGYALNHGLFFSMTTVADWGTIQTFLDENQTPEVWLPALNMLNWDIPQAWVLARFMVDHPACPDIVALDLLRILAPGLKQGTTDDQAQDIVAVIVARDQAQGFVQTPIAPHREVDNSAITEGIRARWGEDAALPERLLSRPEGGAPLVRAYVGDETGLSRVDVET